MRMKGYGQLCPFAKAAEVLAERWTLLLLRDLLGVSGISTTFVAACMADLGHEVDMASVRSSRVSRLS